MGLTFAEIIIDARDATALGRWWSTVLGWRHDVDAEGDVVLHAPAGRRRLGGVANVRFHTLGPACRV